MAATGTLVQSSALLDDLERIRVRFDRLMTHAGERLTAQPAPGSWSAAQCLAHLNAANEQFLVPMRKAVQRAERQPAPVIAPLASNPIGRWLVNFAGERVRARVPAQPGVKPPAGVDPAQAAAGFRAILDEMRGLVSECERVDLNRVAFWNPQMPIVRMRMSTGLRLLVAHMNRHLAQAERAAAAR